MSDRVKNIRNQYLNRTDNLLNSAVFTKDAVIIPVKPDGTLDYTNASCKYQIVGEDGVENISDWTVGMATGGGVTASILLDTITITGLSVDAAIITVTFTHKRTGISFIKVLQVLKASQKDAIIATTDTPGIPIPVDTGGNIINSSMQSYTTVNLKVYNGIEEETGWTWAFKTATSGCVPVVTATSFYINAMTIDSGVVTLTVSKTGYDDREITIPVYKVYQGETVLNSSSVDNSSIMINGSGKAYVPFNPSYFESLYGVIIPKNIAWYNGSIKVGLAGFAVSVNGAAAFGTAKAGNDYTLNSGQDAQSRVWGSRVFAGGLHADLNTRTGAQQVEEFILRKKTTDAGSYELLDGEGNGYWLKEGVAYLKGKIVASNVSGNIKAMFFEFNALLMANSTPGGLVVDFSILRTNHLNWPAASISLGNITHLGDNKMNFPIKVTSGAASDVYWTAFIQETVVLQP